MKKVALFGATGGLGSKLKPLLIDQYEVIGVGSKDVDVTSYSSVNDFFKSNDVDVVVNLSGYNYDCFIHKYNENNIHEISKQININAIGSTNIVSCCLPKMREKRFGRIILASSILADYPIVGTSVYAACKGFVDSLTKTVAIENAERNISCNSLQLGYFDGGLTHRISEKFIESVKNNIPSKRWGTIEELFNTVKFLIETGYVTGQNLKIGGGML